MTHLAASNDGSTDPGIVKSLEKMHLQGSQAYEEEHMEPKAEQHGEGDSSLRPRQPKLRLRAGAVQQRSGPPFFWLPAEIRIKIYAIILKLDQHDLRLTETGDPQFDLSIFFFNRQVRCEALDVFLKQNRWIQFARFVHPYSDEEHPTQKENPFHFPAERFSAAIRAEVIRKHTTLTMRLGYGCGRKKMPRAKRIFRVIFAYNKYLWGGVCSRLSSQGFTPFDISLDLHRDHRADISKLLPDFLLFLPMVRGANRARFTELMDVDVLRIIANNMSKPMLRPEDWYELLFGLKEEGDGHLQRDQLDDALVWYVRYYRASQLTALHAIQIGSQGWHPGSATANSISNLDSQVKIQLAEVYHRKLKAQLKDEHFPSEALHDLQKYSAVVEKARTWPGISAKQRMHIHRHQGYVDYWLSLYIMDDENVAYGKIDLPDASHYAEPRAQISLALKIGAAKEFYYAWDLDHEACVEEKALFDRIAVEDRVLNPDTPPFAPDLTDITTLSGEVWHGSRKLAQQWGLGPDTDLSHWSSEDLHVMNDQQLVQLKRDLGIRTLSISSGQLRFLADGNSHRAPV